MIKEAWDKAIFFFIIVKFASRIYPNNIHNMDHSF